MKPILYFSLLLCTLLVRPAFAQIGMGGQPHSSAVLDLKATDKALYLPRMTTAQRKAMPSPQVGAFVFDLDQNALYIFDGQTWLPLATQNPTSVMPVSRFASDGAYADQFGISVAILGDYALVGASNHDVGGNNDQGAVYVFARTGNSWTELTTLTASDGLADDNFGSSVALSGDYALIGAQGDDVGADVNQGSAYVFLRSGNTWTQQDKLLAAGGMPNDRFGTSVSISGDYALIGMPNDNLNANTFQGSAYVFLRSGVTWTQQAKLIANDGATNDFFGNSVSLSGSYALIGSPGDDVGANANQGSAYVFLRSGVTWTQQAKPLATDGAAGDGFGNSVSISGSYALIGAPRVDGNNANQGAAYFFIRSGASWTQQDKITGSNVAANHNFGSSVALVGDYAIVGAPGDGSAYLFRRNGTFLAQQRYITDNSYAGSSNGYAVGISSSSFIIGGYGFQQNQGKVSFGLIEY